MYLQIIYHRSIRIHPRVLEGGAHHRKIAAWRAKIPGVSCLTTITGGGLFLAEVVNSGGTGVSLGCIKLINQYLARLSWLK